MKIIYVIKFINLFYFDLILDDSMSLQFFELRPAEDSFQPFINMILNLFIYIIIVIHLFLVAWYYITMINFYFKIFNLFNHIIKYT